MAKGAPQEPTGEQNGTQQPTPGSPQQLSRHQQSATVALLDGSKASFVVDRNADGKALFNQVVAFLNVTEKDYFALSFRDDGNRNWVYHEKRIAKQLHGRPWEFQFEVKFYPPEPSTLAEDLTRYLLTLQVRRDIYTGKLPASFATHALLGSFVAQAEIGDFELANDATYNEYLNNVQLAPVATHELFEKIKELHKTHKGQTPAEAELHYLENAKKLTMYGVDLFPAKDGKGTPVTLGVCAHGIMVYRDQIRVNRFAWPKIIKIAYRRNTFSVKLRPGELEKNETTVVFKLSDYHAAKRVWKTAVEHHTFFRLVQPEDKAKKGLFRFGSARFRYNGRTQFQSKMASQMNVDRPAVIVQRSQSARFASRSTEQIAPVSKGPREHTSPLHYADDGHGGSRDKLSSPEKSYAVQHDPQDKSTPAKKDKDKDASKVGGTSRGASESDRPAVVVAVRGSDGRAGAEDQLGGVTAVTNGPAVVHEQRRANELQQSPLHGHVTLYHSGRSDDPKKYRPPAVQRQITAGSPPALLDKRKELDGEDLGRHVEVYHSGRSDDPKKYYPAALVTKATTETYEREEVERTTVTSTVTTREQKSPERSVHDQNTPERKTPDKEMDMVPLKNVVAVYHHGQSVDPPKNEVESESDEESKAKNKKMTARLVLTPEKDKSGSPVDEETEDGQRAKKEKSPGRGFFGFLSGRSKSKDKEDGTEPAITEKASFTYVPPSFADGPTDNLDKSKDLDALPLRRVVEVYHSGYSMLPVKRDRYGNIKPFRYARWPSDESEETIEKKDVKQESYAYVMAAPAAGKEDPPVSSIAREPELETIPLKQSVRVYHSGQSLVKPLGFKAKLRKKIAPRKADSAGETTEESSSSEDSGDEGESKLKKLGAILHLKQSSNRASREASEEKDQPSKEEKRRSGSGFFGIFGGKDKKKEGSEEKESVVKTPDATTATYPISEKYEGPQEDLHKTNVLDDIPLRQQVHVYHSGYSSIPGKKKRNLPFRRFLLGGDEETIDTAHVNLDAYYIKQDKYEGPVEAIGPKQDLEPVPIKQSVRVYHSGQSVVKEKKQKTDKSKKVKKPKETSPKKRRPSESTESVTSSSTDGSETESENEEGGKKKEKKSKKGGGFFGFFHGLQRSKDETHEDIAAVAVPTTSSAPYEGPLSDLNKNNELDNSPLRDQVAVYHSGLSADPDAKKKKMTAKVKVFTRARYESSSSSSDSDAESEDTALDGGEKKKGGWFGFGHKKGSYDVTTPQKPKKEKRVKAVKEVKPANYDYLSKEPYAGELGDLGKDRDELEAIPIKDHVALYHSGLSVEKKKKEKKEKGKKRFRITPRKKRTDGGSSSESSSASSSDESSSESDSEGAKKKSKKLSAIAFIRPSHTKEKPEVPKKPAKLTEEAKQSSTETPPKKEKVGFLHGLLGSGRKEKTTSPEKETATPVAAAAPAQLPSDRHIEIGVRYDGPETSLQKKDELDALALRQEVAVYHSGLSVDPHLKRSKRTGKEKSFRRERYLSSGGEHSDDEVNNKDKSRKKSWFGSFGRNKSKDAAAAVAKDESPTKKTPVQYDYLSTAPAEGPPGELSTMTELERVPIRQLVRVYHTGQSVEKVKKPKQKKKQKEKVQKKVRARSHSTSSSSSASSSASSSSSTSTSSSSAGEHEVSPDKKKGGGLFGFLKKDRKKKQKSDKADDQQATAVATSSNDAAPSSQPEPADAKDKKKKKTKKSKGGKDKDKNGAAGTSSASSSSGSDDSDNEATGKKSKKKKQHKLKKVAGPVVVNGGDSHQKTQQEHDTEPKQDYEPAVDSDGGLVKTVRTTEVYRISGTGQPPEFDPNDTSLQRTLALSKATNGQMPTIELVQRNTTVAYATDKAIPEEKQFLLTEGSGPHTTIRSWQETAEGPETVTTETDEQGNIITRTIKSHQVKQTIQRQTYQTYQVPVDEGTDTQATTTVTRQLYSPAHGQPISALVGEDGVPLVESHSRTIAYETTPGSDPSRIPENVPGEFVSSRTVSSGNRTVETITYKTEKDGVIETHVEHRVTIHSGGEIDHDAELSQAIMEATNMNPDMTVEKIEVKQESQC